MLTYIINLIDNEFHMIYGPIIQPMLIKFNIFTKISQKIRTLLVSKSPPRKKSRGGLGPY